MKISLENKNRERRRAEFFNKQSCYSRYLPVKWDMEYRKSRSNGMASAFLKCWLPPVTMTARGLKLM